MSDTLPSIPPSTPPPSPPPLPGVQGNETWVAPPEGNFQPQEFGLPPLPVLAQDEQLLPGAENLTPAKRFWRKFGGDGFLISVGVHIILIIIALTWVTASYIVNSNKPEEFPTGSGGGKEGNKVSMSEHRIKPKNSRSMVKTPAKLVSKSTSASVSLPDMPNLNMSALSSGTLGGAASKGLGGGEGGGIGTGHGIGRGNTRNFVSPFGMSFKQSNTLEGTLYDLKRSRSGANLYAFGDQRARIAEMQKAYAGFIKNGKRKDFFEAHYASAKDKLYASNLFIPQVQAELATKAFNCEKEIQAPGWLGYYEGWITPPESGSYRFAGMGDDGLLVAIKNEVKLWAPWTQGGMQTWVKRMTDWEPKIAYAPNGSLPALGKGGRYYGSWFTMNKGQRYFIQIVIAEGYGGLFSAELMIQQKSKVPAPLPDNNLPLPVFKLAPLSPEELKLKAGSKMQWAADGPSFGLEINGVKSSVGERSGPR